MVKEKERSKLAAGGIPAQPHAPLCSWRPQLGAGLGRAANLSSWVLGALLPPPASRDG